MVHKWYEKKKDVNGSFISVLLYCCIDYSKAFDLLKHNILINKLFNIGISPFIVRWLASFLKDRSKRVKAG